MSSLFSSPLLCLTRKLSINHFITTFFIEVSTRSRGFFAPVALLMFNVNIKHIDSISFRGLEKVMSINSYALYFIVFHKKKKIRNYTSQYITILYLPFKYIFVKRSQNLLHLGRVIMPIIINSCTFIICHQVNYLTN